MLVILVLSLIASAGIEVHEWGVLLWDGQVIEATGVPGAAIEEPGFLESKAPVICFHGEDFTGTVTVASPGLIEHVYPSPDVARGPRYGFCSLSSMVGWEIAATEEMPVICSSGGIGSDPLPPAYSWAAPLWRDGDALFLTGGDGFCDRFLYYEAVLGSGSFPPPLAGFAVASAEEDAPEADRVLLFTRDDSGVVHFTIVPQGDVSMAEQASPFVYSCDEMVAILEGWAEGVLTPGEARAMWLTWEEYVIEGDWPTGSKAVFVVPGDLVERTSIIMVDPQEDLPVEIRRFFLGIVDV